MATLNIAVQDGNNINVEVVPTPRQTISIDRGVAGVGIESVAIVYVVPDYFLEFTYTNGTTELVLFPLTAVGVVSFNARIGVVTLNLTDVTNALGYTPANSPTNTNITSMTGVTGGISSPDYIQFDTTYATTLGIGQLGWDGNDTLSIGMKGGNVTQHIGEDQFFYIKATAAISKGQVVMFTGAVGASGIATGAPASGVTDGLYIMGVAAESIVLNGFGLVQTFGTLKNVNTSAFADGDVLWYDPTVAGGLTKVKPVAPNIKAQIAAVVNGGSSGGGTILIRIDAGSTLGGTDSNAQITTPTNGQIITYDGQDGYWKNTALTAGTAVSVTPSVTGVLTIANTAPDQVVSITGAGTSVVTGTYPNFTVTSDDQFDGTVTSVSGTGSVNGITLSGTVTSSGSLTLGGALTGVNLTTQVAGTLPIANGGTNATTTSGARTSLGLGTSAVLDAAVALGTATLDAAGTVPLSQIPAAILGSLIYQGTWNASTNTPTLVSSVGTKGYYYVVSAAGSTNLNGITDWKIGDWVIFDGSAWGKVDNTDSVNSVNGYTGTVVLNSADVGAYSNTNPNGYTSNTGTVTSIGGTGSVNGITLTGSVTSSGNLTLGGALSGVSLTTQVSGTLPVANGGTGATTLTGVVVGNGTGAFTTVTAPSGAIVGTTDTQTITAKRINPRVVAASATTGNLTIAGDTTDVYKAEGLTGAITLLTPSGTPVDGQKLMIRLEDNGVARAITWTTSAGAFRAVGITLPTTTVISKVMYVGCVYNGTDSFWDAVATVTQA